MNKLFTVFPYRGNAVGVTVTFFLLFLSIFQTSRATIIIDSVVTTHSTCPNNGTATIYARSTSDSAVFLFNTVSGPVIYPLQNDSTFASLYPGTYIAWVHDINSYDSTEVTFVITGNYQTPVVNLSATPPQCMGELGEIIGSITSGTGYGPFTWEIFSPDTIGPQLSSTFDSLEPGIYKIKLTDACDITQISSTSIGAGGTGLQYELTSLEYTGCNTVSVTAVFFGGGNDLTLKTIANGDTSVQQSPFVQSGWPWGANFITYTLSNIPFGDTIQICLTDGCGYTSGSGTFIIPSFNFDIGYAIADSGCQAGYTGIISYNNTSFNPVSIGIPLTITITDTQTHAIVESYTSNCANGCSPTLTLDGGTVYNVTVTDNCGDTWQRTVTWPSTPAPSINVANYPDGCMDSTGGMAFSWTGFGSELTIQLLSGPTIAKSTKPGFAYSEPISYPIIFKNVPNSGGYSVANMPAGIYVYTMSDSCGHVFSDSFAISSLISFSVTYNLEYDCNGKSTLYLYPDQYADYENALFPGSSGGGWTFDIGSWPPYSVQEPPGIYGLFVPYTSQSVLLPGLSACWTYEENVTIPPYTDSIFKATDVADCNGTIYIHVEVDSANGVLPFQYEIIGGPETFPAQDSSNFTVNSFATYTIGVIDGCGNVDARQITIDTGRFDPVVRAGGLCAGSAVRLSDVSSPYFSYIWQVPSGAIFTGDTLIIYPFTIADTGIYLVTQVLDINGCLDSSYGNYHLVFKDTFQQSFILCSGDTLYVGPYPHAISGNYCDTLSGAYGCDSIIYTSLIVLPHFNGVVMPSDSPKCHQSAITLIATGGTTYLWSPGNSTDSSITVNPTSITVYSVTVSDSGVCSATGSVKVYPYSDTTASLTESRAAICPGDSSIICTVAEYASYTWSNGDSTRCFTTSDAGNYIVTAVNYYGCLVRGYANISFYPPTPVTITVSYDTLITYYALGYQWYLDNSPLQGDTLNFIIAAQSGSYTVAVIDTNGCTYFSSPIAFTGILNTASDEQISVYPNPSSGSWQLAVSNDLIGSPYAIFDAQGQLVFQSTIRNQQSEISPNLASGIYLMQVNSQQKSYNIRLVEF